MQKRKKISDTSGVSLDGQNLFDGTDQQLDALIADWKLPVEVPYDPFFTERVLSQINNRPSRAFSGTIAISAFAAAAILAVVVGVGLGNLVDHRVSPAPENELVNLANDLGIGMTQIDPYEYLLSEEEE